MTMKAQTLRVTAASVAAAAGFGLLAAACGGSAASPSRPAGQHSGMSHTASVQLQVVEKVPGGQARHWSLRCDPAGGTMPDAAAACRLLTKQATILHPVRATHIICASPAADVRTFTITGAWHGARLHEVVADSGCDLRRYSMMAQIFY
jgi:hypothetical protein